VLLCAIALTPTAQLRLRAIEATHAYEVLQQQAAPAQAQREAYLHSVEQLTQVRGVLAERAAPLRLLQLLTETLPDGSFLHSLKTQGLKVTVQGMTPDAAALMQALGRVPGLREVKAPSAAVRNPGASLDSFLIEFQLDPDLLSQAPPASVAPPADAATSATSSPPAAQTAQDAPPPATAASTQALPIAAVASEPAAQPLNTAPRKSRFSMGGS
jgi:general secretion pathway protein L